MPVMMPLPPPSTTRRLGDLLRPNRSPSASESAAISEVHDLATEWAAGRLPLTQVRQLSSGLQRWLATRFTPPQSPQFAPLMRLLDALLDEDGMRTKHGYFETNDLIDGFATIERHDGKELICFPCWHPWELKPNPDALTEEGRRGRHGAPVYRRPEERGPIRHSFTNGAPPPQTRSDGPAPWWREG